MILKKWDDLPEFMKCDEVKVYYDILSRKKGSLVLKRIFDIVVGVILLILLAIPMLVIAVMIKMDSKGPVFYRQERVTRYGKKFRIHKFREINREDIKKARLIANPGCYPTCSTLSIYPLLKAGMIDPNTIIIDDKSGTTGAGRGAKVDNLYCEVNENIKAYGVATHRHTPEIEDQLGYACGQEVTINFTPHLVPMNRGILVTAYASLTKDVTYEEVKAAYDACYENETFVRVLDKDVCPQTKWVEGSNYVDVNFKIDPRTHRIIMMGAIDNLVKGAAGQAVQNMNLMFGFDEAEGLLQVPMYP